MRHYRRRWEESRGDHNAGWGASEWYFEVDDDGGVLRQIEVYDAGPTKRYDGAHPEDDDGGLAQAALGHDEWAPFAIEAQEFEQVWRAG